MQSMTIGIDLSYTSPALCISNGDNFEDNIWYYLNSTKKRIVKTNQLRGTYLPEGNTFKNNYIRFSYISNFFLEILSEYPEIKEVQIEGYSMNSMGQVFDIAENTMLLKHKLKTAGYTINIVAPTQLKKFATGKGNADKAKMQEAFEKQTGIVMKEMVNQPLGQWNPSSDLIDAYYIARFGAAMHEKHSSYYETI